jgi:hypothetical protein
MIASQCAKHPAGKGTSSQREIRRNPAQTCELLAPAAVQLTQLAYELHPSDDSPRQPSTLHLSQALGALEFGVGAQQVGQAFHLREVYLWDHNTLDKARQDKTTNKADQPSVRLRPSRS